jgi:hypothetical protein
MTELYGSLLSFEGRTSMRFDRITIDPMVASGKPCIRNLRFPVSRLLGLLAAGETKESILKAYPSFWWTCPSRRIWLRGCERKGMTPCMPAPFHCGLRCRNSARCRRARPRDPSRLTWIFQGFWLPSAPRAGPDPVARWKLRRGRESRLCSAHSHVRHPG